MSRIHPEIVANTCRIFICRRILSVSFLIFQSYLLKWKFFFYFIWKSISECNFLFEQIVVERLSNTMASSLLVQISWCLGVTIFCWFYHSSSRGMPVEYTRINRSWINLRSLNKLNEFVRVKSPSFSLVTFPSVHQNDFHMFSALRPP